MRRLVRHARSRCGARPRGAPAPAGMRSSAVASQAHQRSVVRRRRNGRWNNAPVELSSRALRGRADRMASVNSPACCSLLQEPGSAARRRYRCQVLCQLVEPASSPQAALRRALLGRWHPDRGLGQHEELCAEGRRRSAVGKSHGSGGRNAERNFHGEKRRNDTHFSTTDPDARLFRKGAGKEAKLCHMGHLMMENRNGLIVDARLTEANGTAERSTALDMIDANGR